MGFNFLNGTDGDQSSKRLFTFIIIIMWVVYFIANLFYGKVLKDSIEENLFYMTIVFYGGVAMEKALSKLFNKKDAESTTTQTTETKTEVKKEEVK
jgi:hypothetical protein